jgi:signal transduction histidine kinase
MTSDVPELAARPDASGPLASARAAGRTAAPHPAATLSRLAALRATALLDTPAEGAFDRLARLAARLLRAPVALVTLVDEDRQFFKSCIGLPEPWASRRETPLSHSFCQHAVARERPLVIEDARAHPLVHDNPAIQDLGVVAYAGIPLVTSDGVALGSFCVIDAVPRRWTEDDLATLTDLAAAVMTEIELRAALERTEAARAEAAAATRAKDEVLAFVSSELRTPLTGIASNAQLLAQGHCDPLTERQARAVERITRSERQLLALTDQLRDFRTIAAGASDYMLARVPLAGAVDEALAGLAAQQMAGRVHVARAPLVAGDAEPVLAVHADPAKLRQILRTLLGHAVAHTPAGGAVALDATTERARVRLHVRDGGPGLPAERLARLFEPFARVRDGHGAPSLGTGLGLAIARALARGMDGDVTAEPTPGAGTTLTLTLPRR